MRTILAVVMASGLAAGAALDDKTLATEGDRWWKHVEAIASAAMAGRDTASPGHKAAADCILRSRSTSRPRRSTTAS